MRTFKLVSPAWVLASLLLAACGGGGSESPPPPDPDPDPAPAPVTLDIADVSLDEGDNGTSDASFTVTLSAAAGDDVTVDYATSDGSARAGSDYTETNGTLSIGAGDTEGTITVSVLGDTDFEPGETFTLTLSNPSANATLGTDTATGTIHNDDLAPMPATPKATLPE